MLADQRQAHNPLAEDWTSLRGAFNTRYDWEYSLRLAEQIRQRGGTHPDLTVLNDASRSRL